MVGTAFRPTQKRPGGEQPSGFLLAHGAGEDEAFNVVGTAFRPTIGNS